MEHCRYHWRFIPIDIILSHLNTYHQYLCDHSVNKFLKIVKHDKEDFKHLEQLRLKKEKEKQDQEEFQCLKQLHLKQDERERTELEETAKQKQDRKKKPLEEIGIVSNIDKRNKSKHHTNTIDFLRNKK